MKTFLRQLPRVVFYGVIALVAIWWFVLEGASPRQLFSTSPAPNPFPDALRRLVSIDVDQRPLDDVLRELSAQHGVAIQVDPAVVQNTTVTGKELVSLKVDGVPLYGVLSLLGRNVGFNRSPLIVRVKFGSAYLTAAEVWYATASNFETRVYPLDQLLAFPLPFDESGLGNAIEATIEPESWADSANGLLGVLESVPGALIVVQTPDVHDQIQQLLNYLQRQVLGEIGFDPVDINDPCHVANAVLREKLRQPVNIEFWKTPFPDIVEEVAKKYELPLMLDPALPRARNTNHVQLSFRLQDVSLLSLLNLICTDMDSSLNIHEGSVTITSQHSRFPWPRKTVARPILDLESLCLFENSELIDSLSDLDSNTQVATSYGQLLVRGSSHDLQQFERHLTSVRQIALPDLVDSRSTISPAQAAVIEAMHKTEIWGGTDSVRTLAARLSNQLQANIWIDADTLRRQRYLDVNQEKEWPEATASVADYFQRNDAHLDITAIVENEAIVITTPNRKANPPVTAHAMGHWLLGPAGDDRWDVIRNAFPNLADTDRNRFQNVVVVHDWGSSNHFGAATNAMSRTRWPPRGVLYSWKDANCEENLCAFDVGDILTGLRAITGRRLAQSSNWPYGALLFVDPAHPIDLNQSASAPEQSSVTNQLASALESVLSLTTDDFVADKPGATIEILDDTALAVVGPDGPSRVQAMIEAFSRQLQKQPHKSDTAVRLDTWNVDRPKSHITAFLYDVRTLLADNPNLNERGLQRLIGIVAPPSIIKKYQYDAADIEVLPGFLVVIQDLETQKSLAKLFQYLLSDPVGQVIQNSGLSLDLSPSVFVKHPDWLAKVANELRTDNDSVCNNFRAWLLGQSYLDSPEAIATSSAALLDYLERTISADNAHGCYLIVSALVHRNSERDRVLPLLHQAVLRPWDSVSRAKLAELLPRFGRRAIPVLVELLESDDQLMQETVRNALAEIGSVAVPDLLVWFDRTKRNEFNLALDTVDPTLATTRSTLLGWEQSGVPELKARTERLRKLLKEYGFEVEN